MTSRRISAATSGLALLMALGPATLTGCSTGGGQGAATSWTATGTTSPTPSAEGTTATAPSPTVTSAPSGPAPTAAPTVTATLRPLVGAIPTSFTTVERSMTDDALGHRILVTRLARDLPWPAELAAQATAFELVGLELQLAPGTTYTATLRALDFSLITGSQYPNRPDPLLNEHLAAAGWRVLPDEVGVGESVIGWLVFKVDPKGATSIRLDYTRPEIAVAGSKTRFPRTVLSLQIVG